MNIKRKIQAAGFNQWHVAEAMGISEFTLSRWLRRPENLDPVRLAQVEEALDQLISERGGDDG